jgi:ABC-type phosphate/phosphonate transport system ATPase subunit
MYWFTLSVRYGNQMKKISIKVKNLKALYDSETGILHSVIDSKRNEVIVILSMKGRGYTIKDSTFLNHYSRICDARYAHIPYVNMHIPTRLFIQDT